MEELKKIIADGKKKYRAFEEADEAMKALDSAKQAEADYKKRVESLKADEASIGKRLDVAKAEADALRNEAKEELTRAAVKAEKIVEKALGDVKSYELQIAKSEESLRAYAAKIAAQKAEVAEGEKAIQSLNSEIEKIKAAKQKLLETLGA